MGDIVDDLRSAAYVSPPRDADDYSNMVSCEACARLVEAEGECRHVDHVQGFCACQSKADAIRARSRLPPASGESHLSTDLSARTDEDAAPAPLPYRFTGFYSGDDAKEVFIALGAGPIATELARKLGAPPDRMWAVEHVMLVDDCHKRVDFGLVLHPATMSVANAKAAPLPPGDGGGSGA